MTLQIDSIPEVVELEYQARQRSISNWATRMFGRQQAFDVTQRAIRTLEEAVELYQACEGDVAMAHKLVDYVFSRPKGEPSQEVGGLALVLMSLCYASNLSMNQCVVDEMERAFAIDPEKMKARNQAKNDAGFLAASVEL